MLNYLRVILMNGSFRSSYAWKKKRAEIQELYHNKCALCGSSENLQAHHIVPIAVLPELRLENSNIILLCGHCHELCHNGIINQTKLKSITKAHT